jgi:hypothetical protein
MPLPRAGVATRLPTKPNLLTDPLAKAEFATIRKRLIKTARA